jgi:lipopolysaccharide/colanic/teichoic acid biosynthesis glycosyltransferase
VLDRQRTGYRAAKRAFDLVAATLMLLATLPVLLLVALALRADSPGPVLFRQRRTGVHGRPFTMYKLRTMVVDADALKSTYAHLNVLPPPDFKIPNDPRITRIGRFLRKTSLDELPQLWNIIRGEMSFVGPRPTSFAPDTWDLWHTVRLEVRPGLTGLWQLRARGDVDFDARLRLDVEYLRNASMLTDLKIMLATVGSVVRVKGT